MRVLGWRQRRLKVAILGLMAASVAGPAWADGAGEFAWGVANDALKLIGRIGQMVSDLPGTLGIAVPKDLLLPGRSIRLRVYKHEARNGRKLLIEEFADSTPRAGSRLSAVKPDGGDYDKYVAPYASIGDLGFIYKSREIFASGDILEFCVVEGTGEASRVVDLGNTNISGCYEIYSTRAAEAMSREDYGRPSGNTHADRYRNTSNPGFNLGWEQP